MVKNSGIKEESVEKFPTVSNGERLIWFWNILNREFWLRCRDQVGLWGQILSKDVISFHTKSMS